MQRARALAADFVRHSQRLDEAHNAYVCISTEEQLREALSRPHDGPLKNTLVAVKDNISTLDFPTTCASKALEGYRSGFDATVVERIRHAGGTIVGKTNLDEFGMGSHSLNSHHGRVLGPSAKSAGGSSGGSAMAVALPDTPVHLAIGTDTGGSIRLPAAHTSTLGFKPSYGLVSRWGVVAYANSLDTVGFLASRSAGLPLLRAAFHATNAHDPRDPTSLSPSTRKRLARLLAGRKKRHTYRFGIPQESITATLSDSVRAAWARSLHALQAAGHSIHSISIPPLKHALSAYYVLAPAEASSNLAKYDGVRYGFSATSALEPSESAPPSPSPPSAEPAPLTEGAPLYTTTRAHLLPSTQQRILLGSYTLSARAVDNYFLQAQKVRRQLKDALDLHFALPHILTSPVEARLTELAAREGVDALLTPTAAHPPPAVADVHAATDVEQYAADVLTVGASLAGLPAASLPVGEGVALQVMGQYGDDAALLDVAQCVAETVGLHREP